MNDTQALEIMSRLSSLFPSVSSELSSINNYTFLVAVLLSAQTKDKSVNSITNKLFKVAITPKQMLELGLDAIKEYIKTIGLYNNKAKNIIALSEILVETYNSEVPLDRDLLEKLPGIGRKSANVILNKLCNAPYIAVDTHVSRVSKRLGLTNNTNVLKIEQDLYDVIPSEYYTTASNLLVMHGRYTCTAKCPKCNNCILKDICKFKNNNK
ncbi:MAG: endonuclease III [Alphaproteobacteria bacterium]|nr:endonuclease III [Alphaproteobacteria bacterium]